MSTVKLAVAQIAGTARVLQGRTRD